MVFKSRRISRSRTAIMMRYDFMPLPWAIPAASITA